MEMPPFYPFSLMKIQKLQHLYDNAVMHVLSFVFLGPCRLPCLFTVTP